MHITYFNFTINPGTPESLAIAESSPKTGISGVLTSGAPTDFVTYFGMSGLY